MPIKDLSPPPKSFPCTVGVDFWYKFNKTTKKQQKVFFKYTDAKMDCEGWVDPALWLPMPYDLCRLKCGEKTIPGWWTGKEWDGIRLKATDQVFFWKKAHEETN